MSSGTSDAFLNGEGIPVELRDVDAELTRLWGPAADREGGPDLEHPTVTRLVLANLVVIDLQSDGYRTLSIIDTVGQQYPCRMIVARRSADTGRKIAAEVSAVCHLPALGRPQVCAERIVLHADRGASDLIPGAVRPLLETDLPFLLWWVGDPRPEEALFRDLADESSRLILDLPDAGTDPAAIRLALDLNVHPFSRDLDWFGITTWREIAAQFFDPPGAECGLEQLESVRIEAVAPVALASPPRVALWLAAWLAGQLGWTWNRREATDPANFRAYFDGPAGPIEIQFQTRTAPDTSLPHLTGVQLNAGSCGRFVASRKDGAPEVTVCAHTKTRCDLPRLVRAPEWAESRRLAGAIESARDDPPYRNALPHLLALLGA